MERGFYKKRVKSGKIKMQNKVSEHERRCLGKSWKEKTSKYRESVKNKTNVVQALISPPQNPVPFGSNNDCTE